MSLFRAIRSTVVFARRLIPMSCHALGFTVVLVLAACSQSPSLSTTSIPPSPTAVADVSEPTQAPINSVAVVDSAELIMLESFPVQVVIVARGQLPDGCTSIESVTQERTGNAFSIDITTFRDAEAICTQSLVPFEEQVDLEVEGLAAGTYTVNVNGAIQSFVLAADNVMVEPTIAPTEAPIVLPTDTPAPAGFSLTGQVFHDLCGISGGEGGAPAIPTQGCVELEAGGFAANGTLEAEEPPLVGVEVTLGEGACPSPAPVQTTATDETGAFAFADVPGGTWCVQIVPISDVNATLLVPGDWTAPNAEGAVTVEVSADSELPAFGWDYQFLPVPEADQGDTVLRSGCLDLFAFDGETVADGTPFEPNQTITKTWRLINTGNCTWDSDYSMVFISGDQMNAAGVVPIPQRVAPGESIDMPVIMQAPAELGVYRGNWAMQSPFDEVFGVGGDPEDVIWVEIEVVEPNTVGAIRGLIWNDLCDQSEYTFGDPQLPPGCLQNSNGTVRGDGVLDTFTESPLPGVTINLGTGECGEAEFVRSLVSAENGSYAFTNLYAGTYCVYIEVLTAQNYDVLIPGNFTVPSPGRSGTTIVLAPDAEFDNINFAWDFDDEQ